MSSTRAALPYVDEHALIIDAPAGRVWAELGHVLARAFPASGRSLARMLGASAVESSGDPLSAGATLPGFRVTRAEPATELALEGAHRFSRYALIFRIDALAPTRAQLTAETRADFPGIKGRAYRTLVIGTRGHAVVVRRLLHATKARAER